jgi:hypothetical protein
MTVEQFNNMLRDFGQQYVVSESNNFWEQAIEKVANDIQAMNITSKPGNIDWYVEGENVGISMPAYLYFQNYGVKGLTNTRTQFGVPREVNLEPSGGTIFQFGVNPSGKRYWGIHYPGIEAKYDFDVRQGRYNITEEYLRYFSAIQQQQSNL